MLPSEFQAWDDCPYVVPAGLSVHTYTHEGKEFVVVRSNFSDAQEWSATCPASEMNDTTLQAMVGNIIGAAFEQKFPGRYMETVYLDTISAFAGKSVEPLTNERMLKELTA